MIRQRDGAATLPCTSCRQELPVAAFRANRYGTRSSWCSPCTVAATREWRAVNRDEINARRRSAHAADPEPGRAKQRARYHRRQEEPR